MENECCGDSITIPLCCPFLSHFFPLLQLGCTEWAAVLHEKNTHVIVGSSSPAAGCSIGNCLCTLLSPGAAGEFAPVPGAPPALLLLLPRLLQGCSSSFSPPCQTGTCDPTALKGSAVTCGGAWSQLGPAVSSTGQPQPLLTRTPPPQQCKTLGKKGKNVLDMFNFPSQPKSKNHRIVCVRRDRCVLFYLLLGFH